MTEQQQNPFVLPGFGQNGNAAQNPLLASMEMMRQTWAGLAAPGGLATSSLAAPMTLEDLDKRISDLRAVENWLKMNLAMLSSTIQGMEVQRATIATLKSFAQSSGVSEGGASPLEVVLGLKPAAAPANRADRQAHAESAAWQTDTTNSQPGAEDSKSAIDPAQAMAAAQPYADAAATAAQGWWSTMQKQFDMLAAATASSFPTVEAQAASTAAGGDASADAASKPSAAKKTAARPAAKKAAAAKAPARKRAAPKKAL